MNAYEAQQRKDTILNGGLVAVAIAWVMLAAVQGPVAVAPAGSDVNYAASPAATEHASATAQPRA